MVWTTVSAGGRSPLLFIYQGVNINQEVYRKKGAELCRQVLRFQAVDIPTGFATVAQARKTLAFLHARVVQLVSAEERPPYSPDLNPMDFSICSILKVKVSSIKHQSVDCLRVSF